MRQIWASDPQFNAITTLFMLENCVRLGYNATSSGNFLPTFRDRVSVPSSRVSLLYFHATYQKDERRSLELSFCSLKYCVSYFCHDFPFLLLFQCGPGSSVGITTDYGLDGPGSSPSGDEIFHPYRPVLGPTQPPVKWIPVLCRG